MGLLLLLPTMVLGQVLPYLPEDGFLSSGAVPDTLVGRQCLTPFLYDSTEKPTDLGCRVVEVVPLAEGPSVSWLMARYRRSATKAYEGYVDTLDGDQIVAYEGYIDTLDVDQIVLIRHDVPSGLARPLWTLSRERTFNFLQEVVAAQHGGVLLVAILICLNGTGGCYQEFLMGQDDTWQVVDQVYLPALEPWIPTPYRLHKGRRVDVHSLVGRQPLSTPKDANCCPSGLIHFEVALEETRMVLVESTIRVEAPTVADQP